MLIMMVDWTTYLLLHLVLVYSIISCLFYLRVLSLLLFLKFYRSTFLYVLIYLHFQLLFQITEHTYGKNYTIVQDSKKFDCPAKIKLLEMAEFPSYKLISFKIPTICCLPVFWPILRHTRPTGTIKGNKIIKYWYVIFEVLARLTKNLK